MTTTSPPAAAPVPPPGAATRAADDLFGRNRGDRAYRVILTGLGILLPLLLLALGASAAGTSMVAIVASASRSMWYRSILA